MKILLVGFSRQSAEVLQQLIIDHYEHCTCVVIDRYFNDNLRLCLPKLPSEHGDAKAIVINTDGVGMMGYHDDYIEELQMFIGIRSAILVTRAQLTLWQSSQILPDGLFFCLKSPFNKEIAIEYLDELIKAASQARSRADEFNAQKLNLFNQKFLNTTDNFNNTITKQKPKRSLEDEFLHQLIDTYFNIPQSQLLHDLLDISSETNPLKITAGSQVVYIDHQQNIALIYSLRRLIDYCAVVKKFETLDSTVSIEVIDVSEFNAIAEDPKNDYKKYALNTILWQIHSEILPETINISDHQLMLKMRYMPNFAEMGEVPEYVRTLVSSCIVAPRSIAQIRLGLEGLGGEDITTFNRVFLLAILSGAADIDILKQSINNKTENDDKEYLFGNIGVQTAKKTGFFARLLNKLKISN